MALGGGAGSGCVAVLRWCAAAPQVPASGDEAMPATSRSAVYGLASMTPIMSAPASASGSFAPATDAVVPQRHQWSTNFLGGVQPRSRPGNGVVGTCPGRRPGPGQPWPPSATWPSSRRSSPDPVTSFSTYVLFHLSKLGCSGSAGDVTGPGAPRFGLPSGGLASSRTSPQPRLRSRGWAHAARPRAATFPAPCRRAPGPGQPALADSLTGRDLFITIQLVIKKAEEGHHDYGEPSAGVRANLRIR